MKKIPTEQEASLITAGVSDVKDSISDMFECRGLGSLAEAIVIARAAALSLRVLLAKLVTEAPSHG